MIQTLRGPKTGVYYDEANGVQANYDENGVINTIFVYSAFTSRLVKVDVEAFEQAHPSRYSYIQSKVNEQLLLDGAFKAAKDAGRNE